jgi:CDP-6-deoxy-D-xylo-4-hexulose-3-dehydrase
MIPLMKTAFFREYETRCALAEFITRTTRLSMDAECFKFEKAFAGYQGVRDAILFNSGGSANLAMLQSLRNLGRLRDGAKVGFSALTWSTNTMPIMQLGMEAVPIDCNPNTLNTMRADLLAALETTPLDALFITNALGFCGDLDAIRDECKARGIILIEDNCEALGTRLPSGRTGSFGEMASFSFFVAHHMSTIEGGMVCTDDDELAEMLRIVRANGWDRNLTADQQRRLRKTHGVATELDAKYTFYDLAYNVRPTEVTGFLGNYQLQFLAETVQRRAEIYDRLSASAAGNADLHQLDRRHITLLSSFAFPVVCTKPELRARYIAQFSGAGIEIRPMIAGNIQRQPFFKKYSKHTGPLPGAEHLHTCGFYCGLYPELTESDIQTIVSCLQHY